MKITITDDALEANEKVIFVGVSIFASILALLVKMDCLPRVAEQRDAPVHAEQKCPFCEGKGIVANIVQGEHTCDWCDGTGISTRSAGG